ncbi:MAG: tetratricopeptide repeat protein, partial [Tenuifilaceae bacterium]|nr:tetratricopeptide repeat protein [Tenuifilaceae bacterium]
MANIRALFFKLFLFLLLMLGNGISPAQNIVTIPQEKQAEIERFLELAQRYKQAGNLQQTIFYLNKVAFIYWEHGALREAVNYFLESVPLNEKVQNLNDIKAIYSNIGLIYTDLDRLDLALEYFNKSLEVRRKLNNKADIAAGLIDVAYLLTVQNQFEKAIPLLEEAYQLSQKVGNPRLTLNCLRLLANCYERIGNTKKASEYNNLFASVEQHLATQQVKVEYEEIVGKTQVQAEKERMERMAKQLELEYQKLMSKAKEDSLGFVVKAKQDSLFQAEQVARQQQIEIDLINKDRELKEVQISEQKTRERTQQMIIYSISIFLLLLTLLAIVVYKNYKDKKRANVKLSEQNYEIQRQKDQIQRQNENITKSINYAQGIQKALLPAQ